MTVMLCLRSGHRLWRYHNPRGRRDCSRSMAPVHSHGGSGHGAWPVTRAYATRLDGAPEGGPRSRAFRAFHLAHISAAAAKVLAFELQHGSSVLHAKLGLA